MEPFPHFRHATEPTFLIISILNYGDPRFIQAFETDCSLDSTAPQSLWTTVVQSLVVICRDPVDVCLVGFPYMCRADDLDHDAKGSEPSEYRNQGSYLSISSNMLSFQYLWNFSFGVYQGLSSWPLPCS